MKKCYKCKVQKPPEEFNKNSHRKDGLQTSCRVCTRETYRTYYKESDRERIRLRQNNRINRKNIQDAVRELKNIPCADCNNIYPYYVMDFDHLNDKNFEISDAVAKANSIVRIKEEIAKCEVVCSNCHRIRTHNRRAA